MKKEWPGRIHQALLAGKEEDRFTEYLAQLLKSELVLNEFLSAFVNNGNFGKTDNLSVQTRAECRGVNPDLVIRNSQCFYLFEAKVDSWFHGVQIKQYAKIIDQKLDEDPRVDARLFLIVPDSSIESAAKEADSQLGSSRIKTKISRIMSWQEISKLFCAVSNKTQEIRLKVHLQEFAELVEYKFGYILRPFTSEEVDLLGNSRTCQPLVQAFQIMYKIMDALKDRLGPELTANDGRGKFYHGWDLYYLKRSWWFGIWFDAWADLGHSPIFLQLKGYNQESGNIPEDLPGPIYYNGRNEKSWIVPLAMIPQVPVIELINNICDIAQKYIKELPFTGRLVE